MANPLRGIASLGGNILGGLGNIASGVFGTNPGNPIGTQIGTAVGNILGTTGSKPITQQLGQFIGNILGTSGGGASSGSLLGFKGLGGGGGGGLSGLLGGGGIGTLLAAGVPAYFLGKAAMEEAKNQTGVPLIPLTQETGAGRYNIEAEIRRRMGLPAPDPVEFGMLPAGTLPELSGGRAPGAGGAAFEFASRTVPNLERPTPSAGGMTRDIPRGSELSLHYIPTPGTPDKPPMGPRPGRMPMPAEGFRYSRGTTVFDKYDPETDTFIGSMGGVAGMMPIKISRAEAPNFFPGLVEAYDEYQSGGAQVEKIKEAMAKLGKARKMAPRPARYRNGGIVSLATGGDVETEDGEMMDADEFKRMSGEINGEGTETSDDIPAMLSDGEYVMTGRAVRGAGAYDLNVGDSGIITLTPGREESRERGTDLMYQMMALFEEFAGAPEED